uniref:hypothetical protein n=1 Tax=Acetatifactor sp. TaxID=1872090 RepID=UPI004055FC15
MLQPFHRLALCLYKWGCIHKLPLSAKRQVQADLEKLYPGERKEQILTEYCVNKLAKSLMIAAVGLFFGVVIGLKTAGENLLGEQGGIARGSYAEGTKEIQVKTVLGDTEQIFSIEVSPRLFAEEELIVLRETFAGELNKLILGENASLKEVTEELNLQETYEGYPFVIAWESSCADVIGSDGAVSDVDVCTEVELKAVVSYEEMEWEEILHVQVIPRILSEEERIYRELEGLLIASEEESRLSQVWQLPTDWEGQKLTWNLREENTGLFIGIGTVAVALLIYFLADKDLHDQVEKRKLLMKKSYPDIVHKLALYLGAGMTIRGAFQRIAEEYEKSDTAGGEGKKAANPICEELLHICRELKAGVSEGAAYEHFGKRTGLQEYIRLSTLLTQNLKKGNSTLLQRLREEALKATAERIQYGRRLGEEAVTKLLVPMVLMLLVVMLMIMIPAFSSVGM